MNRPLTELQLAVLTRLAAVVETNRVDLAADDRTRARTLCARGYASQRSASGGFDTFYVVTPQGRVLLEQAQVGAVDA